MPRPAEGDLFPDLELPDHRGAPRTISELVERHPAVVHFYRGWWCPKEQTFMRNLVDLQEEVEVAYSRIVSITTEPPALTAPFRAGLGARWTFLSDESREVQRRLGLEEQSDPIHRPFIPTAYVLDPERRVESMYNGYWYWGRPTNEELRRDLRAVSARIRADWDPLRG